MANHSITAVFDTRSHADQAVAELKSSGVPASDITLLPAEGEALGSAATGGVSFWGSLEQLFSGTEDRATYAESIRRGGITLTVRADEDRLDGIVDVLERHGSVDLDERERSWRSEGWTGAAENAAGMTVAGRTPLAPMSRLSTRAAERGDEDVVQVVEERLDVDKRVVSRGKVRLHSYVVESQVSEDVTLRVETVSIDRYSIDRPVAALGAEAFWERTIELEEFAEEAVVAKSARVVEEIGIHKEAADRIETINETLRKTVVDIDDARTGGTVTGALGRFAAEIRNGMEVVGSDGIHVGTVDYMNGGRIKLKKADVAVGGEHHYLTHDIVQSVAGKVMLAVTAAKAEARLEPSYDSNQSDVAPAIALHDEPIFDFAAEAKRLDVALGTATSREDAMRTLQRIAADATDIFSEKSEALSFLTEKPLDEEGRDGVTLLMERGLPSIISRLDDIRFGFQG
ncbi:DUF2382 domain-containing protein [Lichenibacterium minor]|uniref:DUF2382 domain-containing protein n=1 Tax=Lichenibacterium minor TaxID=2316528 RepID=A0A4Q2U8I7_9HYPH|nr:DUF2382 domain-containing protein [Lichenibacterium minor]